MIHNTSVNEKKYDMYFWILFLVIYCSHDTLMFGTNVSTIAVAIRKVVPIGVSAVLLYLSLHSKIRIQDFLLTILVAILPLASCVVNNEPLDNYVYRAFIIFAAGFFVITDKQNRIIHYFNDIMAFLSVWSIVVFLIANLMPVILSKLPVITNTSGFNYYNAVFSTTASSELYGLSRNQCIFREPGVFMVFLTYAFFNELCVVPKARTKYIVIYSFAMLTTLSTAGYIIFAAIIIYMLVLSDKLKNKEIYSFMVILLFYFLITKTDILSSEGAMFGKFSEGTEGYGSWFSRLSSITGNIDIFMSNPVFGVGRYGLYDTILDKSGIYKAVDNTNTLLINFAAFGFLFGILNLSGIWKLCKKYTNKIIYAILFFIMLFAAMSNEDMGQNIIYYILVFKGLFTNKDIMCIEENA